MTRRLALCCRFAGLNNNSFFFRGVAPFALTPGCYRSRLRREIQFLLIVNLLKLTPSSKPVPCPLRASETSPLVIA